MKKIISIIIAMVMILSLPCFTIPSNASGVRVVASASYVDEGQSIITGTSYNNNYMSLTSSAAGVAVGTFDSTTGSLTIKGISSGYAEITLRLGTSSNYKDYVYPVNVISVFDNVTYSYSYDKITVNYDKTKLPSGCTPVFSIDGKSWSESNTLTRNKDNDGFLYKAFKVEGVVTGSIKVLQFDTKANDEQETINKDIEMKVGDTYCVSDDIKSKETYNYYYINGRSNVVSFDETTKTITATSTGNTTLSVIAKYADSSYSADGSISSSRTEYKYSIKVKSSDSTDNGSNNQSDNNSNNTNNNSSSDNTNNNSSSSNNSTDTNSSSTDNNSSSSSSSSSNSSSSSGSSSSGTTVKNTEGTWKYNGIGWWFEETDGSYPAWSWRYIGNHWYFFDRNGYMMSNCYMFGCWLNSDGSWNTAYSNGTWKCNSVGWWYEDNGWYPTNQWLMIDGYWYYFKADGYMAANEYIDGYWLGADGAWR